MSPSVCRIPWGIGLLSFHNAKGLRPIGRLAGGHHHADVCAYVCAVFQHATSGYVRNNQARLRDKPSGVRPFTP